MRKPNLFNYATNELSHDAFIAWLLEWSDPEFSDSVLHSISNDILKTFFQLTGGKTVPEIDEIKVVRQFNGIDIFTQLTSENGELWGIIIENKTYTSQHSDQLNRYKEIIEKKTDIPSSNLLGVYYKMWEQSDLEKMHQSGFVRFDRTIMLNLIERHLMNIESDILLDYYHFLRSMQKSLDAHRTKPVVEWKRDQWIGFYSRLKNDMKDEGANFDYVANRGGGFQGYWFGSQSIGGDGTLYVQAEEKKLCFKIYIPQKENRQNAKWFWHDKLLLTAKRLDLNVVKPKVMRVGEWFTIGVLQAEPRGCWMKTDQYGILDYSQTLEIVNNAIKVVEQAADNFRGAWAKSRAS